MIDAIDDHDCVCVYVSDAELLTRKAAVKFDDYSSLRTYAAADSYKDRCLLVSIPKTLDLALVPLPASPVLFKRNKFLEWCFCLSV